MINITSIVQIQDNINFEMQIDERLIIGKHRQKRRFSNGKKCT